jgi:hypothetical protein
VSNPFESLTEAEQQLEQIKQSNLSVEEHEKLLQAAADQMSLLVSCDEDLMANYDVNMAAFKNYYPDIYSFFSTYQPVKTGIDTTNGFVNALNSETGNYLYAYPSYLETLVQFEKFKKLPNIKRFNFNFDVEKGNEANFIHVDFLDKMLDLLPQKSDEAKENKKNLSGLVVFGVGAGYHLELISQYYNISCINIAEPDLDLFFVSLFSVNWDMILNNFDRKGTRVFISLGEQKDTFFEDFMKSSHNNGRYQLSHVAGYIHYKTPEINSMLNEFNRRYTEMGQGLGFFDDAVMSIGHMLGNLKNQVPLLRKMAVLENKVSEVPVFIVGNGPSLDELVDTIKAYQNRAIVISCGSALSALYKYGIKPDFHCEQERTFPVAEKITHYCPVEFLEGIILLAPTTVHPEVYSLFDRKMMAAKQHEPSSALLERDVEGAELFTSYHFINPTVANTALVMGYNLGFKNFFLCGIDLGHKRGDLHHSKKSLYYDDQLEDKDLYEIKDIDQIEVPGNFGGTFICDPFFNQSNFSLSKQILGCADLNCYNLSDGALIPGSIPKKVNELASLFELKVVLEKNKLVSQTYANAIHEDKDLLLYNRLVDNLDYALFDDTCERLITLNKSSVETIREASDLLLMNTDLIRKTNDHIHDLLIGTVMHIQVILTQLLYEASNDQESLELFNKGLAIYRDFLAVAPVYYRDNAENAHYVLDCQWIVKLRNTPSSV